MKRIKSYILCAAAALTFAGCQDDFTAPGLEVPVAGLTPNTTIAQLKETYWNDATNYADTIRAYEGGEHVIIAGRVISSDEEGNIYKSLVIQDETAALAFSINASKLCTNYRVGQEIVLDVTDMIIGKYAGLQQIGRYSIYERDQVPQVSFMSLPYFQEHAFLNGLPEPAKVDTIVVNSISEIPVSGKDIIPWQSQLVRLKNVSFLESSIPTLSVFQTTVSADQNRTIADRNGSNMIVRTSGYATFSTLKIPQGNLDLVGILSYYNSSWQLMLIDVEGIVRVGEQPGTKDKPYTVSRAIEDQKAGIKAEGWVKGYIVGATAPGKETITSNADINFTAPFLTSTNLVIAESADVKDYTQCIVVALTPDSPFQKFGNLRNNPTNLGRAISVYGKLDSYLGTYGLTGNSGAVDLWSIDGVSTGSDPVADGDGTEAKPYNCAQIIKMNPTDKDVPVASGVWVSGYIVGFMPAESTKLASTVFSADAAVATNLVLGPTPDCNVYSQCITVQLPSGAVRDALNLSNNPKNLGQKLAIKGNICYYSAGPGVKGATEFKLDSGTSTDPVTPPAEPANPVQADGTILITGDMLTLAAAGGTELAATSTLGGYTLSFAANNGTKMPAYYTAGSEIRLYAFNSLSIAGAKYSKIEFTLSEAAAATVAYPAFTPSTGKWNPAQAPKDKTITWEGSAADVKFTVSEFADFSSNGQTTRPAELRITKIHIYPAQ